MRSQSAFYDGKQPNWFHQRCFFLKQRPAASDMFDGFNKLRKEDQDKVNENIGMCFSFYSFYTDAGAILSHTSIHTAELVGSVVPGPKGKGKGKKRAGGDDATDGGGLSSALLKDFGIEYAASGRAACPACFLKISKDELRIRKTVYDTEVGMKFGGQAKWHHVECFAQLRAELGWFESGEVLPGFSKLKKDDKVTVKKHIP